MVGFYDELQSYIPILPKRDSQWYAHQLRTDPVTTIQENYSNSAASSVDQGNQQDSQGDGNNPTHDATREAEPNPDDNRNQSLPPDVEEKDVSNTIWKTVSAFSTSLSEEMIHQRDAVWNPLSTSKVLNQEANSEDNTLLRTKSTVSPVRDILDRLHDENLTVDELKQQIQLAVAQLEEQNRWEAFRLQEAVRAQALQDQQELEKRRQEIQQYYNDKFVEEWKWIQQEMERRLEQQLKNGYETIESQLREEMEGKLAKRSEELEEEYEQRKKALIEEMDSRLKGILEQERKNRLRMLENLQVQVRALRSQFLENSNFQHLSSCAHRIASIAYGLEGLLEANQPFSDQLHKMKMVVSEMSVKEPARTDQVSNIEMLKYLIMTIPQEAAEKGIPSEAELIDRFYGLLKHLRYAALIPEEKVSSIWSHIVAFVISRLKIPEKGLAEGDDAESRIARAEYFVTKHNLLQVIRELEGLNGLCAEMASDWLSLARWRVTVQQAVQVSRAFVVLEEEALA